MRKPGTLRKNTLLKDTLWKNTFWKIQFPKIQFGMKVGNVTSNASVYTLYIRLIRLRCSKAIRDALNKLASLIAKLV